MSGILNRPNKYIREKAVEYALKYVKNPNPYYRYFKTEGDGGGDCTNFVSQCLFYGGAPMDYKARWPWWYKGTGNSSRIDHAWSVSWAVAHSLYWCLKSRGKSDAYGLCGIETSDMDVLELGDIIQYEKSGGIIYHSAIITGFSTKSGKREPLITQHSIDAVNIPYFKPAASKAHFMKILVT
nr:amidase domain-containing protein [Oxobacter pfennigii]